jgi:hypothetical protein
MENICQDINDEYISDKDLYVDDDIDKIHESSDSLTFSWVSVIEEELGSSITEKVLSGSVFKETEKSKLTDVEMIINLVMPDLDDLDILEYQSSVASFLRKSIKNHIDKVEENKQWIETMTPMLDWLINSSKYLSKRIGLDIYNHKSINPSEKIIPRSSYKFCNYNYECEFNYNTKKHKGCFAQHFVHSMIYADLCALKEFIYVFRENLPVEEIRKSLNTISFVINHMCDELRNIVIFSRCCGSEVHIERTPQKKTNNLVEKNVSDKKKIVKDDSITKKSKRGNRRRDKKKVVI